MEFERLIFAFRIESAELCARLLQIAPSQLLKTNGGEWMFIDVNSVTAVMFATNIDKTRQDAREVQELHSPHYKFEANDEEDVFADEDDMSEVRNDEPELSEARIRLRYLQNAGRPSIIYEALTCFLYDLSPVERFFVKRDIAAAYYQGNVKMRSLFWSGALQMLVPRDEQKELSFHLFDARNKSCVPSFCANSNKKLDRYFPAEDDETITIPNDYTSVSLAVFEMCSQVKKIVFEAGGNMANLPSGAFCSLSNLQEVILPDGLQSIENYMFADLAELRTVVLPDGLLAVYDNAFDGCVRLSNVNLPESLVYVAPNAFSACLALPKSIAQEIKRINDEFGKTEKEYGKNVDYVQSNGAAHYSHESLWHLRENGVSRLNLSALKNVAALKQQLMEWHQDNDTYFDKPTAIYASNDPQYKITFSVLAEKRFRDDILCKMQAVLGRLGWEYKYDVTKKTRYLLVDTDDLPAALLNGKSALYRDALASKRESNPIMLVSFTWFWEVLHAGQTLDYAQEIAAQRMKAHQEIATRAELLAKMHREEKAKRQQQERERFDQYYQTLLGYCQEHGPFESIVSLSQKCLEDGVNCKGFYEYLCDDPTIGQLRCLKEKGLVLDPKQKFDAILGSLQQTYSHQPKVKTLAELQARHPELGIGWFCQQIKRYTGKTPVEFLTEQGILVAEEPVCLQAKYAVGSEPPELKAKVDAFFAKLLELYPDKQIVGLNEKHKKLGERCTELYRALGYPNNAAFLMAYGFSPSSAKGGRPSKNDPQAIVAELKNRYAGKELATSVGELKAQNPDMSGQIKFLGNNCNALFGMSAAMYLKQEGILADKK